MTATEADIAPIAPNAVYTRRDDGYCRPHDTASTGASVNSFFAAVPMTIDAKSPHTGRYASVRADTIMFCVSA